MPDTKSSGNSPASAGEPSTSRASKNREPNPLMSALASDSGSDAESAAAVAPPTELPWGARRERALFPESVYISTDSKPGEFVLQTLFAQFTVLADRKIGQVLAESTKDRLMSKSLQRGEDPNFDQVLTSLSSVAENCLPSLLCTLFEWYDRQNPEDLQVTTHKQSTKNKGEKDYQSEKRDLAVDIIYCLVLIEVLKQLPYHPGHDDLIQHVINQAFRHFKVKEGVQSNPNGTTINAVADLYAEVIGVLAMSRFQAVRKRFTTELKDLRSRDQNSHNIVSLLMGMKFFRVKMHPIEEFQACVQFLHDLGTYFLEVRDKDIKHALAGLFVEILLPVAAVVKNEVNVPVLKNFVEMMYTSTYDLANNRKKHFLALTPLVTCLLCVSQKQFFLNNWPSFLGFCLSKLKDKESKIARVALESLYRLLWVYMIRVKCESNTTTTSRLQSIVQSLFPRGTKTIMPKDTPLNIFVKIIQFIAQERLDFAMREIIFDLLCVGKPTKIFNPVSPERMSIGLRAFLVIADSLQQKDGDPPMPQTMSSLPSGNTLRFKKTFINKYLSEEMARVLGMVGYYAHVRKAFDAILKQLDQQVGKPLLMCKAENVNREPDEMITGDRKPKIDLFRICVAAIPRLLPEGIMTRQELIAMQCRLTVHVDDELGRLAFQSLQNLVVDLPEWRNDVLSAFVQFIEKEVADSLPLLLDQCNRRLIQLLTHWKTVTQTTQTAKEKAEKSLQEKAEKAAEGSPEVAAQSTVQAEPTPEQLANCNTLHELEGYALIMLCSCKPTIRKQAVHILKEVRNLFTVLCLPKTGDTSVVLDIMDKACPAVIERVLPHLPLPEKVAAMSATPLVDFQWLADRTSIIWQSGGPYHGLPESDPSSTSSTDTITGSFDPWIECMCIFMQPNFVVGHCIAAVTHAWPTLFARLQSLLTHHVDPNLPTNEGRSSSLLRSSRKMASERDMYMSLWKNYVVMSCCMAPPYHTQEPRSLSPDLNSSPEATTPDKTETSKLPSAVQTSRDLFKLLVPLVKCDQCDMRESIVIGLSHINPAAFRSAVDETLPLIKDAIDRKENIRRKRKRDVLRLSLARIFHYMAENSIFAQSPADVLDSAKEGLCSTFVEYIDGATQYLETEAERESDILLQIRQHFTDFIRHLIRNTPVSHRQKFLSPELRRKLFNLFDRWSGQLGLHRRSLDKKPSQIESFSSLELSSVQAMSAVLCCGLTFDSKALNDENDALYAWLNTLLGSHNEEIKQQIYQLAQETIVLMLEFNPDAQVLLDWVIDRCYTGTHEVADGCFNALARVFSNREYSCDHVAMLNVTLLYTGCPRIAVQETAVQLLHLLYKRFFLDDVVITDHDVIMEQEEEDDDSSMLRHSQEEKKKALQEMLLTGPYSRTQLYLSQTLAKLHPKQLTMAMFSEITQRFQTAIPAVRQLLLQYLLPWLYNMELVDPNLPPPRDCLGNLFADYMKPPLQGEGWGSPEATEMVLNNLFYITALFGDDHAKEIEDLWAALVTFWPANLQVVVRYLVILSGMAPTVILPHAKRVIIYLGRAKPERLVDEMMNELRTTEPLTFNVERTPTPPFYRLTSLKKHSAAACDEPEGAHSSLLLDKGQIHTKRHSGEDQSKLLAAESTPRTSSVPSLRSEASSVSSVSTKVPNEGEEIPTSPSQDTVFHSVSPVPFPLPMPAFGGYFAPLSELLPEAGLPNPPYQRCNLSVMLLTDLVLDSMYIDWTVHLPLMLHVIFLGLDHNRPAIHEHCRKLLLNLLLVLSAQHDHFNIAQILLGNRGAHQGAVLTMPCMTGLIDGILEGAQDGRAGGRCSNCLNGDSVSSLPDVETWDNTEQVARALIEFIITRKCRPLWSYEDITSKVHNIHSVGQLEHFLKYVLRVFKESQPLAHIEQRWAQEALHLALSCSSRHYAGRSFQIFRSLHVPVNSSDLSDILSRLVETVAEQGEDMQGYVTEIMLTLEAAVDNLDVDLRPLMREIFLSTPNLNKEARSEMRKSATITPLRPAVAHHTTHYRSTSFRDNLSLLMRRNFPLSPGISETKESRHQRHSSGDTDVVKKRDTNLKRSTSAHSLKQLQDQSGHDDKLTILSQMFWIAVSLLESDFEYEFLLAVRLLDKVLKHIQPERPECKEKLDKIQQQISWVQFPGVQALLLKGCTSPVTGDATWNLLAKLTLCINATVMDPSQCNGFPMNVTALLPRLVEHYEEPNKVCTEAADHIAQMCREQSEKLDNLATVMTLYSRGTFGKDSFQWTKCVIKYLYDVYSGMSDSLVAFLVEVLERGPIGTQSPVLQILHCIVHYIDIAACPSQATNTDLLRTVTKYIETAQWKDSLKILKLCVTRSSTLSAAPPTVSTYSVPLLESTMLNLASHTSFAEAEVMVKKELPGRTMDFDFDMSKIPVIGQRHHGAHKDKAEGVSEQKSEAAAGTHQSTGSMDNMVSDWKRPHLSQERTRKRLRNLLTCYGHTVLVPASPSVIFSQESPSDTLARQTSVGTSSEETSLVDGIPGDMKMPDDSSGEQNEALSAFDFLDDPDPVTDMFWGVKRPSPEAEEGEPLSNKELAVDSSDDESPSGSPVEDLHQSLPGLPTITLQNTVTLADTMDRASLSGSTHSIHSGGSDLDTTLDLSPSTSSPSLSNMVYISIPSDEVEDLWAQHVTRVMMDSTGQHAVNTFHLFARLFHESRRRVYSLTKEACYHLSKTESIRPLAAQLANLLEVMVSEIECSLVYVDSDAMTNCHLLQKHKLNVQEIDESFETFVMRRDQAVQYLDLLKTLSKESSSEVQLEEHKFSVCRCLYRLHFHLVQLYEVYCKLVDCLVSTAKPAQVTDMSRAVCELREELLVAASELSPQEHDASPVDPSISNREDAEKMITDCLAAKNLQRALVYMRGLRSLFPGDMFGVHPSDEVECLLYLFSRQQAESRPGIFIVCQTGHDLSEVWNRLIEIKVLISSVSSQHHSPTSGHKSPVDQTDIGKAPDSSTL